MFTLYYFDMNKAKLFTFHNFKNKRLNKDEANKIKYNTFRHMQTITYTSLSMLDHTTPIQKPTELQRFICMQQNQNDPAISSTYILIKGFHD